MPQPASVPPLVPLAEYEVALQSVSKRTIGGASYIVLLLFLAAGQVAFLLVSSPRLGPVRPNRWWQAVLACTVVSALGAVVSWWVSRRHDRIMRERAVLVCPHCDAVPYWFVRLTGKCSQCCEPMLELPEADLGPLLSHDDFAARASSSIGQILWFAILPSAGCFAIAVAVFAVNGNVNYFLAGMAISAVAFVGGVCFAEYRADKKKFHCPNCALDLCKWPRMIPWVLTTGRCHKCAHVVLDSLDLPRADFPWLCQDLWAERASRLWRGGWSVSAAIAGFMVLSGVLPMLGVPRGNIMDWVYLLLGPVMTYGMWNTVLVHFRNRCPLCNKANRRATAHCCGDWKVPVLLRNSCRVTRSAARKAATKAGSCASFRVVLETRTPR